MCRKLYSFVLYLYVNGSGSITSVGEERANLSAVVYLYYVVFVWRGFLFLWVLGMGYVIILWHSLSLPYNYFTVPNGCKMDIAFIKSPQNRVKGSKTLTLIIFPIV